MQLDTLLKKLGLSILSLSFAWIVCGCATTNEKYSGSDSTLQFPYYPGQEQEQPVSKKTKVYPWEIWTPGQDLEGLPITNFTILQADKIAVKGQRAQALERYLSIDRRSILPQEEEALVLRIASTQLTLGKTKESLTTISDYFAHRNESANAVSGQYAIVLGFGYGTNQEIEQSLAWFSRAHNLSSRSRTYNVIAVSGVKSFLERVSDQELDRMTIVWASDSFIRQLIAEERVLRSQRGTPVQTDALATPAIGETFGAASSLPIGVLLPMTGKYSSLGQNTNKGLELALSGAAVESKDGRLNINLIVKDSGGDVATAMSQARELISNSHPSVIVGPLLSEPAVAVSDLARESQIPMLTFSKKDAFVSGGGVFRFGATATSQVETLLQYVYNTLNLTRIAIVYPNDTNGIEFAEALKKLLMRRGVAISFERSYNKDDLTTLIPIAQELEQSTAQSVFFPDNILTASRFFTNLSAPFREKIKILATASWDDLSQLSRFQTVLEGATFVSPFYTKSQRPLVQKFIETYRARYSQEPDFLVAQGYDAGILLLAALKKVSSEGISLTQALAELAQYDGLTGVVTSAPNGELQRTYTLVEFKNGALSEVSANQESPEYIFKGNKLQPPAAQQ